METIKHLVGRARPATSDFSLAFSPLSDLGPWHSFPSGDAANAFLVACFLAFLFPRHAWLAWSWSILLAASRVALARHSPADVIAGAGVGMPIGSLVVARLELPMAPGCAMPIQRILDWARQASRPAGYACRAVASRVLAVARLSVGDALLR